MPSRGHDLWNARARRSSHRGRPITEGRLSGQSSFASYRQKRKPGWLESWPGRALAHIGSAVNFDQLRSNQISPTCRPPSTITCRPLSATAMSHTFYYVSYTCYELTDPFPPRPPSPSCMVEWSFLQSRTFASRGECRCVLVEG